MINFLRRPKNAILIVSLLSIIGGGIYHWWVVGSMENTIDDQKEIISEQKEEISSLELEVERKKLQITKLQDSIESQNSQVEKWKSEAQEYKEQVENAQEKAQKIRNRLETQISNLEDNRLTEDSTCKESMNWLREKAMKELRSE